MSARATGSPSHASSVTSGPVTARPDARIRPSALSGSSSATCRAARPIASPDTYASRHPRLGQPPGHGGPFSSMTMWPSSGPAPIVPVAEPAGDDHPAADPRADRQEEGVGRRRAPHPRATPRASPRSRRCRPRPAARCRSRMTSANGRSAIGRCTEVAATPRRSSMRHAMPKPTPTTGSRAAPRRLLDGLGDRVEERCGVGMGHEPLGAVMDPEVRVDHARQELRASQVDADHAGA